MTGQCPHLDLQRNTCTLLCLCADILLSCCARILGIMDHFFSKGTGQRQHRDETISGPRCKTQIRLKARVGQRFLTQGEGRGRPVRMRRKTHARPSKTTPFFATQDKTLYLTVIPPLHIGPQSNSWPFVQESKILVFNVMCELCCHPSKTLLKLLMYLSNNR